MHYADIVLPLAQPTYTFSIPEGMEVEVGCAVAVQFGSKGYYTGIVWRVHDERPPFKRVKSIHHVIFPERLLDEKRQQFWEWMSRYYLAELGLVMRVALPSWVKPRAESDDAFLKMEFHPRTEQYFRVEESLYSDEERLSAVFDKLEKRAKKQYDCLLEVVEEQQKGLREVPRRLLRGEIAPLRSLQKKGVLLMEEHPPQREQDSAQFLLPELTPSQQQALLELKRSFGEENKRAALLQGVTGSGKTEIYIHLIAEVLAKGGDVLMLVPEIALTSQLIQRMERVFGSRVTAYHSKLTNLRRSENFMRLTRSQGGELVVGARSALFLPLNHLQLIIVDEEHDMGYKQTNPAPRYQARDCAVMMAHLFNAHTLLGSATPSLETWLNAKSGKYGFAELKERYGDGRLPKIILSDTLRAAKRGERQSHFNQLLLDKIEQRLQCGEQVMLFQNRRGFAPYVECPECGWTARCPHCNVSLTYHKAQNQLMCHYCGYTESLPSRCPACHAAEVAPKGFGTEKVSEQIARIFPEARVGRLDRDMATSEKAFGEVLRDFSAHKIDILVGTQMITKGFDFEGVSLVGILNADNLLLNPDFRASERAFQLMMQVAGRAGRKDNRGEVVIQTSDVSNPVIRQVVEGDYEAMARMQLSEREAFFYPPYSRLTALVLRCDDVQTLRRGAAELAKSLRGRFGRRVLGPMPPPVDRIRGEYLMGILLKVEHGASSQKAKEVLQEELRHFTQQDEWKRITIQIDVDTQ